MGRDDLALPHSNRQANRGSSDLWRPGWGFAHFKAALLRAGFSEKVIEDVFAPFGQGFKDMSPAVRTLESMLLKNELRHGAHPPLTMCVANSVVVKDPAGTEAEINTPHRAIIATTMVGFSFAQTEISVKYSKMNAPVCFLSTLSMRPHVQAEGPSKQ
ncbi:hypothetical protein SAMN05421774_101864 [Gemmobacter megaterium]|uniref:Uncharacterized protein n=1 Tax=Gemmobacter megaterium TaxID=1086013 RepID=A0A1N7L2U8_9RHOB|nr:hypothetical protein [Gemmobacter megaterium]GGE05255.1 hypothetical protein GCM10011345_08480 [Gemmobacter megaterium]SIS68107.1 hypothetical protein SAMN05421774_101864 [Gemmobacter megaterium]